MGGGSGDVAAAAAEDEYAEARISVWWDIENCAVPRGCDAYRIAQNIKSALGSVGYNGPLVDIKAYGDTSKISQTVQQALSSTGVSLNHVPAGIKDASDKKILVDMIFWAVDNPPPANYLLISGDRDFSYALHRLRMKRYNILLAHAPNVSEALVAAAKVIWHWKNLVAGKSPSPECSYNSHPSSGGTLSSSEKLGKSISDAGQMTQSSDPPTLHLVNQDITNNGKDDNRLMWKEVKRLANQGQENISSNEKPVSSTEKPVINAKQAFVSEAVVIDSNRQAKYGVESNQINISATSNLVTQEISNASNIIHPSVTSLPSPLKPPIVGSHPFNENNCKEAPHQFFHANKLTPSARGLPSSSRPNSSSPMNNGNHLPQGFIPQHPRPLRPSDLLPSQPNTLPGNLSSNSQKFSVPSARPNAQPFTSHQTSLRGPHIPLVPPGSLTDGSRLHISQHSSNGVTGHHNSSYIQQNPNSMSFVSEYPNDPRNPQRLYHDRNQRPPVMNGVDGSMSSGGPRVMMGSTASHADEESLVASILNALYMLKAEKLAPTEANIADCIRYGEMNINFFNIQAALHFAIKRQIVVMHKLGNNLPLFILKNDALWKCVNIMDASVNYPMTAWDAILKFLFTKAGCSSMMASECKYHAAVILKKSCLPNLVLGDVIQILHVMITVRKWIEPHFSGWKPLSLHLPGSGKNSKVGASIDPPNKTVKKC